MAKFLFMSQRWAQENKGAGEGEIVKNECHETRIRLIFAPT